MTDGDTVAGWQASCLRRVVDAGVGEIVVFIADDQRSKESRGRRDLGLAGAAWTVLDRAEAVAAAHRYRSYWERCDVDVEDSVAVASFGAEIPLWRRSPTTSGATVVDADPTRLRDLNLDVLIDFRPSDVRGESSLPAANGIWSFQHGESDRVRNGPPALGEVVTHQPYTTTFLQRSDDQADRVVLRTARHVTVSGSWSQNRRQAYAKSARMLVDALKELQRTGTVTPVPDDRPLRIDDEEPRRELTLGDSLRAAAAVASSTLRHKIQLSRYEQVWRLLLWRGALEGAAVSQMEEITAPPGRYWADPFVVEDDGQYHLFFEEFDIVAGRGHISTGRLTADGLVDVKPVLQPDYHLSYPFVFELDGAWHMIPESCENETIELWRCTSFPGEWERVHALMSDISAADSTLLHHDGLWYLFTNLDRDRSGDHGEELHLFLSNDLSPGSFEPHPANPVVADAACARMGGSFRKLGGGRIIRPAQRGGEIYGTGLHFCEVTELSPTTYREHIAETILPNWDDHVAGIHHCSTAGEVTILDAARWEPARLHHG